MDIDLSKIDEASQQIENLKDEIKKALEDANLEKHNDYNALYAKLQGIDLKDVEDISKADELSYIKSYAIKNGIKIDEADIKKIEIDQKSRIENVKSQIVKFMILKSELYKENAENIEVLKKDLLENKQTRNTLDLQALELQDEIYEIKASKRLLAKFSYNQKELKLSEIQNNLQTNQEQLDVLNVEIKTMEEETEAEIERITIENEGFAKEVAKIDAIVPGTVDDNNKKNELMQMMKVNTDKIKDVENTRKNDTRYDSRKALNASILRLTDSQTTLKEEQASFWDEFNIYIDQLPEITEKQGKIKECNEKVEKLDIENKEEKIEKATISNEKIRDSYSKDIDLYTSKEYTDAGINISVEDLRPNPVVNTNPAPVASTPAQTLGTVATPVRGAQAKTSGAVTNPAKSTQTQAAGTVATPVRGAQAKTSGAVTTPTTGTQAQAAGTVTTPTIGTQAQTVGNVFTAPVTTPNSNLPAKADPKVLAEAIKEKISKLSPEETQAYIAKEGYAEILGSSSNLTRRDMNKFNKYIKTDIVSKLSETEGISEEDMKKLDNIFKVLDKNGFHIANIQYAFINSYTKKPFAFNEYSKIENIKNLNAVLKEFNEKKNEIPKDQLDFIERTFLNPLKTQALVSDLSKTRRFSFDNIFHHNENKERKAEFAKTSRLLSNESNEHVVKAAAKSSVITKADTTRDNFYQALYGQTHTEIQSVKAKSQDTPKDISI